MNMYTFQIAHDWMQLTTKWEEAVGFMRVITCWGISVVVI